MTAIGSAIGGGATRVLHWWAGELAALLPDVLGHRLPGAGTRLLLDLSGPGWVLRRRHGSRRPPRTIASGEDPGAGAAQLRELGLAGRRVELRVPAAQMLVWRLTLPLSAETELVSAVAFQIERRTPFDVGQTHFAHRVLRRDPAARQIEVEVALVTRAAAEAFAARAASLGLAAVALRGSAAETDESGWPRIALPAAPARRSPWRWPLRALALSAAILAGAIVQTALAERSRTERHLDEMLRASRAAAESVQQQRQALERLQGARDFLIAHRRETPSVTRTLDTLSRLLPDQVWLTQFSLAGLNAQAAGHAPAASALIGLIDSAEAFSAPRFLAAVTLDTTIGLERFNLAFTVAGAP